MKSVQNYTMLLKHFGYWVWLVLLGSCQKNSSLSNADCLAITPTIVTSPSSLCGKTGSISIVPSISNNYTYRLNGGMSQSGNTFTGLAAGTYRLTILAPSGCKWVDSIAVAALPAVPGPLFLAVKNLFAQHCLGCHSGNNPQAGLDLSRSCDIENHWQAIRARAVDGAPSPMPQAGLLPAADRKKITDWIAAGHSITH